MIEHFRNGTSAPPDERRKSPRYAAGTNQVWIGWWSDGGAFVTTAARIVNISLGGAYVSPESPPPQDRPSWLCQGIPEPVDSVEVGVIEVVASRQGQYGIRVKFREPCPYSFFKAVIDGTANPAALAPAQSGEGVPNGN